MKKSLVGSDWNEHMNKLVQNGFYISGLNEHHIMRCREGEKDEELERNSCKRMSKVRVGGGGGERGEGRQWRQLGAARRASVVRDPAHQSGGDGLI